MTYRRFAAVLLAALLCATGILWQMRSQSPVKLPGGRRSTSTNPNTSPSPQVDGKWTSVERRILHLTNEARAKAKLKPLEGEDVLREAAVSHSEDMLDRHFFDHVNPSGEGPEDRISRIHRRLVGAAGENIWAGSGGFYESNPDLAGVIMDQWMHSAGHRANILRKDFTHLGVGVVIRGLELRATQDFARVRAYLNVPLPERAAQRTALDLSTHGELPAPEMFDLEPLPEGGRHGAMNPLPIVGARLDAPPGRYRVRLYFPTRSGAFEVFGGPSFVINR